MYPSNRHRQSMRRRNTFWLQNCVTKLLLHSISFWFVYFSLLEKHLEKQSTMASVARNIFRYHRDGKLYQVICEAQSVHDRTETLVIYKEANSWSSMIFARCKIDFNSYALVQRGNDKVAVKKFEEVTSLQ